jgi:hypothetical protein
LAAAHVNHRCAVSKALRVAVVALLALLEIAGATASIAAYRAPSGIYGFLTDKNSLAITSVAPGSPAGLAGIAAGDRLNYSRLSLRARKYALLQEEVPAFAPISLQVARDNASRAVILRASYVLAVAPIVRLTAALAGLALGIFGLLLVLSRPSRMTWGFAFAAPPLLIPISVAFWSQQAQTTAAFAWDVGVSLLYAAQVTGAMIFAARFPGDRPRGVARAIDRLALPVGFVLAAIYLYVVLALRLSNAPPAGWIAIAYYGIIVPAIAALAALISTFATTPGDVRSRLAPLMGAFVFLILAGVLHQLDTALTSDATVLIAISMAFYASPALVAAAVAYGVVRHRVMDVNFIVSRTLVYTILTVSAAALFTSIEFVFGKVLSSRGVAIVLEIAAAIGIGLSLDVFHKKLDGFIDQVLFRRRHLAERRLNDAARALPYATTADAVDDALVDEASEALELASAAIFRHDGDGYRRVHARGWNDGEATALGANDRLLLRLRNNLEPLDPEEIAWRTAGVPGDSRAPIYAVPVVAERRLEAIALYGGHTHGEGLDPDERRCLRALAQAAAEAYEHLASTELRQRLAGLEAENASLRSLERKLTELLGRRLQES